MFGSRYPRLSQLIVAPMDARSKEGVDGGGGSAIPLAVVRTCVCVLSLSFSFPLSRSRSLSRSLSLSLSRSRSRSRSRALTSPSVLSTIARMNISYAKNLHADSGTIFSTFVPFPRQNERGPSFIIVRTVSRIPVSFGFAAD